MTEVVLASSSLNFGIHIGLNIHTDFRCLYLNGGERWESFLNIPLSATGNKDFESGSGLACKPFNEPQEALPVLAFIKGIHHNEDLVTLF